MSKSKTLIAAETRITALEARLSIAKTAYRDQAAHIAELEAALNTRGVKPVVQRAQPTAPATPVITEYTKRDGTHWQKIRTGNTARHVQMH